LILKLRLRTFLLDGDRSERIDALWRAVLERRFSGLVEEHIDDDALGGRQDDVLDHLLALVAAAVATDQLHPGPGDADLEDARVRRIGQIEADDLTLLHAHGYFRLTSDEEGGPEATHGDVIRLMGAKGSHAPILIEQDVVERKQDLAMRRRPVVGLVRDDEDVPVEAHLLAVVLADVRVVPVEALVGEAEPVREALAHGDRRLRLMRPVVLVFEPQPVPMHGRFEIALVDGVHKDF
jgi:hypothetical protein